MTVHDMSLQQARAFDRKRWLWPMGFGIVLLVAAVAFAGWFTGLTALIFAGPIILYGVVPLLDLIIGKDSRNPPERVLEILEHDPSYRYATYVYVVVQLGLFVGACALVGMADLAPAQWLGFVVTTGMLSGVSINTAHELGHKNTVLESWLAMIALAPVAYGHFYVEHNRGHHVRVATPQDPASARMGESYWAYLPRTVVGSLRSAWPLEARRLARAGHNTLSVHNEVLQAWAMTLVLWGALTAAFGADLLAFLIVQAAIGISVLEAVNYCEHYGLLRKKRADGRYERCCPEHSWNNDHIVTNIMLFHLQRHADHHAHPTRRYQSLRHFDSAPQLPTGYAGMIVLAYLPALWYAVMDKRVLAHYDGDLRRANLQPSTRVRLLAKYPPPVGV